MSWKQALRLLAVCAAGCLLQAACWADAPSVSYIFPAGGQRGTKVDFHVGGHYLHDRCPFEMLGPGVAAAQELVRSEQTVWFEGPLIPMPDSQQKEDYPWAQEGSVSIAANAPLGFRRWRVWTSQGVTPSMKFVIGDLPEVVEDEIDGDPLPTSVRLPVTINGRVFPREDVDIWTFEGQAGISYTCEVMAARLGSPLDSRLVVYGPDNRPITENVDSRGTDSFLRFTAPEDGRYAVHIHDVDFRGLQHYVYRLTITDQPYVDQVYPLGGRRGTTRHFELLGQRLPAGPVLLSLPKVKANSFSDTLLLHGRPTNRFTVELSDLPDVLEVEPNDNAEQAASFDLGTIIDGRIDTPGDSDNWWFETEKGQRVDLDLHAARLGSLLDSRLAIFDEAGKQLASNDDGQKGQADSRLAFTAPAGARYRIEIRDHFASRGGPDFGYRLHATWAADPQPDFKLQLPTDGLTVTRGGEAKLKVVATRTGGFQAAITLAAEGLPAGVTLSNNTIPEKKNETQLTFKADDTAKIDVARLRIRGSAQIGEAAVSRLATRSTDSRDDVTVDHLLLAVAFPTPFKVTGIFETRYAARGSTFVRHYTIDRGGYEGPLTVRMAERQVRHLQGVTGATIEVPAGKSEFDYAIHLPPWMEVGRTSRTAVMAVADVADSDGRTHHVSYTSHAQNDQVIVLVDPGQLAVRLGRKSIVVQPGQQTSLNVHVGRGQGIEGQVEVRLIVPDHLRGVSAEPVRIPADDDTGVLTVRFAKSVQGPWNMPLTVRAIAAKEGQPYTAEGQLSVVSGRHTAGLKNPVAEVK